MEGQGKRNLTNPLCMFSFNGITLIELAGLATAAYGSNATYDSWVRPLLDTFLVSWDVKLIDDWHPRYVAPQVCHFRLSKSERSDQRAVDVYAIRGTTNSVDMFADLDLWTGSAATTLARTFVPLLNGYGAGGLGFLGAVIHAPRRMLEPFSLVVCYNQVITEYLRERLDEGTAPIITGHSLGGGLAKLAAVEIGLPAVSYSGPGISTIGDFGKWRSQRLLSTFVNVQAELDVIGTLDLATGTSMSVPCRKGIVACHLIERTMCMMSVQCGHYDDVHDWCNDQLGSGELEEMYRYGAPYEI